MAESQKEIVLAAWRHCQQKGEARSNEPDALYAGFGSFVVMVADARKHGQGRPGVWGAFG